MTKAKGDTKKPEAGKPERVTLRLTNEELVNLKNGLTGFLKYEAPKLAHWHADNLLERLESPIRVIERHRERIIKSYAQKGEDGQPLREIDEQGRVGHVIPRDKRLAMRDELDAFMKQPAEKDLIFPASWRIPFDAIPENFVGDWQRAMRRVILMEMEDEEVEPEEPEKESAEEKPA
jgi:hypothetical protein